MFGIRSKGKTPHHGSIDICFVEQVLPSSIIHCLALLDSLFESIDFERSSIRTIAFLGPNPGKAANGLILLW
jgi:hypothetical protein